MAISTFLSSPFCHPSVPSLLSSRCLSFVLSPSLSLSMFAISHFHIALPSRITSRSLHFALRFSFGDPRTPPFTQHAGSSPPSLRFHFSPLAVAPSPGIHQDYLSSAEGCSRLNLKHHLNKRGVTATRYEARRQPAGGWYRGLNKRRAEIMELIFVTRIRYPRKWV